MKSDAREMTPEKLERMSRENVEYWLLHEMHRKPHDFNTSLVQQALERIAPVTDADTEEAHLSLLMFHWEHDAEISVRRKRRHRAHATMLVVLLLMLMTAVGFALGVNIWQVAYEWAAEHLFMQLRPNVSASLYVDTNDGLEYIADVWGDAVYEMMIEYDIHVRLPAWKPEGFAFQKAIGRQSNMNMSLLFAQYSFSDDRLLALSLRDTEDTEMLTFLDVNLEADISLQKEISIDGTKFFIMSNLERTSLMWIDNTTYITLSGSFSSADAEAMIRSIKEGGN